MKKIFPIILFLSFNSFSQELKTMTITFNEITLEEVDGNRVYIEYKDSLGEVKFDLTFSGDIIIGQKMLYDYDEENFNMISFDEKFAKELIGKKAIVTYEIDKIMIQNEPYFQKTVSKTELK